MPLSTLWIAVTLPLQHSLSTVLVLSLSGCQCLSVVSHCVEIDTIDIIDVIDIIDTIDIIDAFKAFPSDGLLCLQGLLGSLGL